MNNYIYNWMKCPFRLTSNGDMKNCYGEQCMAFRQLSEEVGEQKIETYWCALIVKQKKKQIDSIKYKDDI